MLPVYNIDTLLPGDQVMLKDVLYYGEQDEEAVPYYNCWCTINKVEDKVEGKINGFTIIEDNDRFRWLREEIVQVRRPVHKKTTRLPRI